MWARACGGTENKSPPGPAWTTGTLFVRKKLGTNPCENSNIISYGMVDPRYCADLEILIPLSCRKESHFSKAVGTVPSGFQSRKPEEETEFINYQFW